jgi:hypothetical protein
LNVFFGLELFLIAGFFDVIFVILDSIGDDWMKKLHKILMSFFRKMNENFVGKFRKLFSFEIILFSEELRKAPPEYLNFDPLFTSWHLIPL